MLATYLTELALVDASMLAHPYSLTSAAALHVALAAVGGGESGVPAPNTYPHALARHAGYPKCAVLQCAAALVKLMQKAPTNSLSAVFKKYSHAKQLEVAAIAPPTSVLTEAATALADASNNNNNAAVA